MECDDDDAAAFFGCAPPPRPPPPSVLGKRRGGRGGHAGVKRARGADDEPVRKASKDTSRDASKDTSRDASKDEALEELLHESRGFPLPHNDRAFRMDRARLRDFCDDHGAVTRHASGDAALGGVYWVHKSACPTLPPLLDKHGKPRPWYEAQPWWPQLTVQAKANGMNPRPPPPFRVWYTHPDPAKADYVGVPRFFGLSHFGAPPHDLRTTGERMADGIVFNPDGTRVVRPEQEAAFKAALATLRAWGGAFLQADCGMGKSSIVIRVLLALGVKSGIVCTQEVLMRQMMHDIRGKPWTWPDLTELTLAPDGSVKGLGAARCAVLDTPLSGTPPHQLVRVACVQEEALVLGGDDDGGDKDGGSRKRPRRCFRYATARGMDAWFARPPHARVAPPCATCGGVLGPRPAWELASKPRLGWAPRARVGWLQGAYRDAKGRVSKRCDVVDKDIVLISAASAAQCDYPWATFGLGALAFDEAHTVASPTISQVVPKVACRYVLGVSATPDRMDGLEHVLYWLLGPAAYVYKRTRAVTGVSGSVHVHQVTYTRGAQKEITYRDGSLGFAAMINALAADAERNRLLLHLVTTAVASGRRKVLVITALRAHCRLLVRALKASGFYDTAELRGGMKAGAEAYAQHPATRIVVATYAYLSVGYDDECIDTMILATPRGAVQQTVGRCERTHDGKLTPLVYDIVDPFSAFVGMSWKRHRFYTSRAFAIARVEDAAVWAGAAVHAVPPSAHDVEAAAERGGGDGDGDDEVDEGEDEDEGSDSDSEDED